jgi:hypothetical protein
MHAACFAGVILAPVMAAHAADGKMPEHIRAQDHLGQRPQWTTSSRLLKLGETIEFQFYLPEGASSNPLRIFQRYLEQAEPGDAFKAGGNLDWVNALPSEEHALTFTDGVASFEYAPSKPGSYLARWEADGEAFFRYFSAVEDDWTVLRFSTFLALESEPTLHGTGIPLDYRLPVAQFTLDNALFRKFLDYHRHYGDTIVPAFPDTPDMTIDKRAAFYGDGLARVRSLLPDPGDGRSARVEMRHDLDPGYTETFMRLGINDHCGLNEANARPWLGMPEFPYFSSPVDCRKINQGKGGQVVAHQWDFCGGWHFLGPVSWHYKAGEGDWAATEHCLRQGMAEFQNLAAMSGHPAFVVPLYDGFVTDPYYPNELFTDDGGKFRGPRALAFVERYQRVMAFTFPKEYKVAYARSIDISDYYRRHFSVTPRTVFVSKTDHIHYDLWWLCTWGAQRNLVTRKRLPWLTRVSSMRNVLPRPDLKDPLSQEFILVEDQHRSIRFERECPNPLWWFDYTGQERGPGGSASAPTLTPDVTIHRTPWRETEDQRLHMTLTMDTQETFPDYAIALWGLPESFDPLAPVETNAKECLLTKNTDGEHHLVLFFDLAPDAALDVTITIKHAAQEPADA